MDTENFIKSIRASKYSDAFDALVEAKRFLLINTSSNPIELMAKELMKKGFLVNDTNPDSRHNMIMLLDSYKTKLNMSNKDKQLAKILGENIMRQIDKLNENEVFSDALSSDDENHPYAAKPKKARKPRCKKGTRRIGNACVAAVKSSVYNSHIENIAPLEPIIATPFDYDDALSSDYEDHPYAAKLKKARKPRCKNGTRRVGNNCVNK